MLESYSNNTFLVETLKATATSLPLIDFSNNANKREEIEIIIKQISLTNSKYIDHLR